jgi:short-subunit dehydrogenase
MSRIKLKPLNEQVIVITGATSGIGLATARAAAKAGARVMLAGRDEAALKTITVDLNATGAQVDYVIADMRDTAQVQAAADRAIQRYGGFDTWVNNAGGSIYGRFDEVPMEEQQDLFDTNYWGIVRGSTVAVAYLRQHGGALINLGSEVSDIAIPLQSAYVASKHAVKGFTDALRLELIDERAPVSVTLIKPSGSILYSSNTRATIWTSSRNCHRRSIRPLSWPTRFYMRPCRPGGPSMSVAPRPATSRSPVSLRGYSTPSWDGSAFACSRPNVARGEPTPRDAANCSNGRRTSAMCMKAVSTRKQHCIPDGLQH